MLELPANGFAMIIATLPGTDKPLIGPVHIPDTRLFPIDEIGKKKNGLVRQDQ